MAMTIQNRRIGEAGKMPPALFRFGFCGRAADFALLYETALTKGKARPGSNIFDAGSGFSCLAFRKNGEQGEWQKAGKKSVPDNKRPQENMMIYIPTAPAAVNVTAPPFVAITETELDQALRQCYQRKLTIPAVVIEEELLLYHLSLIHYGQMWAEVGQTSQQQLTRQCRQLMHGRGWTWHGQLDVKGCPADTAVYRQWLEPDLEKLESGLGDLLHTGQPVLAAIVQQTGLFHAFNAWVESDPEGIIAPQTWSRLLARLGYEDRPRDDGQLHPHPIPLPADADYLTLTALRKLQPAMSKEKSPALVASAVIQSTIETLQLDREPTPALTHQLLEGPIGQALILLGYETKATAVWGQDCTPPIETEGYTRPHVFLRAMTVGQGIRRVALTQKFAVLCPVLVVDEETLVYLELLGPREAVKANWAALRNGGGRQLLGGQLVQVRKGDQLTTLKTPLPCGWDHWCLFHRQVSTQKMTPAEPFYLLSQGEETIPSSFYPLLSRALAAPTLPAWADYLWMHGRRADLITAVTHGCHGMAAWKIDAANPTWEEIISSGIRQSQISF